MYIKKIIYFFHYKIHSGHDLYDLLRDNQLNSWNEAIMIDL